MSVVERLAAALAAAIDEHGAPNSFGLQELYALGSAPAPFLAAGAVIHRCKDVEAELFARGHRVQLEYIARMGPDDPARIVVEVKP